MNWQQLRNGELLLEAAKHFDVFLTVDKNIEKQQNLNRLPLPIILLDVVRNTPEHLLPLAPFIEKAFCSLQAGQMIRIDPTGGVSTIGPTSRQ
ncbi:MAG TPA: hypothetical protein VHX86_03075 [Tepidisphaeraceae bacterium]|jgi:hypothetical protein|nr:hypothetical protein [Tepidisphaeraceae bacterium]